MARVSGKSAPTPQDLAEPHGPSRPWLPVRVFQFPGNAVANLLHATSEDDRMAIRVLIDMLFWNVVAVLVAILIYSQFG